MNNGSNPKVSIMLFEYQHDLLEGCLDSIFGQNELGDYEVVMLDMALDPVSWEIMNRYMRMYPDKITISTTQAMLSIKRTLGRVRLHNVRGEYFVLLTRDRPFEPSYIAKVLADMESDPLLVHAYIGLRRNFNPEIYEYLPSPEAKRSKDPLVSVCVFNYEYGRYLGQCLESIAAQTYKNIEICFSDNASKDDSWDIALNFKERYGGRMSLTRNRQNFGPGINQGTTLFDAQGKYLLYLCSDDAMKPTFIERCVDLLECFPDAGFAMVHRDVMDDQGNVTPEPPFYDRTSLIPGRGQTAVYMMSSVNPSISQILYRRDRFLAMRFPSALNSRWFGARIVDFDMCCHYPMIYINEPLLLNRVHAMTDGTRLSDNLMQCIGEYTLVHQFAEKARELGFDETVSRLGEAVRKIGRLCLRYCARALVAGDEGTAMRYFKLSEAICPDVVEDSQHQELSGYWSNDDPEFRAKLIAGIQTAENLIQRKVSYTPPPDSVAC